MQLSNARLNQSVIELLDDLLKRKDLPGDVLYDVGVASAVLSHTSGADRTDGQGVREHARQWAALLREMQAHDRAGSAVSDIGALAARADGIASTEVFPTGAKAALIGFMETVEVTFTEIANRAPEQATPLFAAFAMPLLSLQSALPAFSDSGAQATGDGHRLEAPTEETLAAYFQTRLSDPTAEVSNVVGLPGGFGKETTLFTLTSANLTADLVMRRDPPIDPLEGLDCHSAPSEFPLLKAVHNRGVPVPEPLFVESGSEALGGSSFTIMRRASGKMAGDAMGVGEKVSEDLQDTLARIVASIHAVEPMPELASNPMFGTELWGQTATQVTHRYVSAWRERLTASAHTAAPAVHSLMQWLLANVPQSDAATGLVHGDVGFHNLLFDDGRLTAILDWEFSHVGDPAEDLGYIRSVMGGSLDWPRFLKVYGEAGRPIPSEQRVRYFEIWSHARNAAATVMMTGRFETGEVRSVKFGILQLRYFPHFIVQAQALVSAYAQDFPHG